MIGCTKTLPSNRAPDPKAPDPLIVYVHTAKTGGSTINKVLRLCSYRGREHCQWASETAVDDVARNGDWLSGHLPRDRFTLKLVGVDRPIEYFSSVREPISQIISFLNWFLEIRERGQPGGNCPSAVKVQGIDYSDPASIMRFLLEQGGYFLNCQSTYVIGTDFALISQEEFVQRLASYAYIATEHSLPQLYRAFKFAELHKKVDALRENSANRHFDRRVFQGREIREFFARHHAYDLRLYDIVRNLSWPTRDDRPCRSARFTCQFATPDDFVEQDYLDANPDVADAVRLGQFASGRQHFDLHGRSEQRLMVASKLSGKIRLFGRPALRLLSDRFG